VAEALLKDEEVELVRLSADLAGSRSETVSRPDLSGFAICREIFRNCRESDPLPAKFPHGFKTLSLFEEQGAFYWFCREEQRGMANGSRVGFADYTSALAGGV
jgi:hypothetical protein